MKRPKLVSSFLEQMSGKFLVEYREIIRRYVRGRSGIYALYRDRQIYYVGLARNLMGRLDHHLRDRHKGLWNRFSVYLTIGDGHIRELESLLLRIWKPSGNTQKGKFPGAENLERLLRRDVDALHKWRKSELFGEVLLNDVVERSPSSRTGRRFEPCRLRARFKGKTLWARFRSNGSVRFGQKVYKSPSGAARAAVGRQSAAGWHFWRFERAPGDWVPLDAKRRR